MRSIRLGFPRRQLLLFLLAVTVPCIVVVALGYRLVAQDRELTEKRTADERRRVLADVRKALAERLERIRSATQTVSAHGAADPAVIFTATIHDDRLFLPWEEAGAPRLRALLANSPTGGLLQQAERDEFGGRVNDAIRRYRIGVQSDEPEIAAWSKFLLARVLSSTGSRTEAHRLDAELAGLSFEFTDEHGIPLALYAAQRQLARGGTPMPPLFFDHALKFTVNDKWISPGAMYLLMEIAEGQARTGSDRVARIRDAVAERLRTAEQLEALRGELIRLPRTAAAADQRWTLLAKPQWIVNASTQANSKVQLIGVHPARLVASLPPPEGATALRLAEADTGDSLGEEFPGLRIAYTADLADGASAHGLLRRRFYLSAGAMVVSLTLLAGYLLWRDVGREMRTAALRAQFVASISHELKTPLTSIRMFADTLRLRPADDPVRDEYLQTIVNESERLTRLLNNVLDFSRIEQDLKTYRLEPIRLSDALRSAARTLEFPLAQAGFELRIRMDDAVPMVRADADALQQAVLNLLTNAMKFSGASRRIDLTLSREGDLAIIAVIDAGIGIDAPEHQRLFERFYRVRTRESEQIAGTGLGLTIVRHIVAAHGGEVTVRSAPGRGSTFTIRLPLIDVGASATVATEAV